MLIHYSGEGTRANPEIVLGNQCSLMLTYHNLRGVNQRFERIVKSKGHAGHNLRDIRDLDLKEIPVGIPESHFLDSGSFSIHSKSHVWARKNNLDVGDYYYSDEFHEYLEGYAQFVQDHSSRINLCANLDVLPFQRASKHSNVKVSARNLKLLLKRGVQAVPVVHYQSDPKLVAKYAKTHEVVALGGLVGNTTNDDCIPWLDACFRSASNEQGMPKVKIHGFGITSFKLLLRYPWWSVDSATWTKLGAFGGVLIPHKRFGEYDFSIAPWVCNISSDHPSRKQGGKHYFGMTPGEQKIVRDWVEGHLGLAMGRSGKGGCEEFGVITHYDDRKTANLFYFERLRAELPEYPQPFKVRKRRGFFND